MCQTKHKYPTKKPNKGVITDTQMPKSALHTGDIIINERGNWFMVLRTDEKRFTAMPMACQTIDADSYDRPLGVDSFEGCLTEESFEDNLYDEDNTGTEWNVKKVLRRANWAKLPLPVFVKDQTVAINGYELLWERPDPVFDYTIEELEKILGKRIRIVDSNGEPYEPYES